MTDRKPAMIYQNPKRADALKILREAILQRLTIIVTGNCWVDYQGRASSKLEPGERIVIIKEDGSLLVHRPIGYEPVNWQPPGCIFQTSISKDALLIRAMRRKPRESLRIYFDNLYFISILSLIDKGKFSLHASEEDMQRAILIQPSLVERGLRLITYEKKVEPGFIDVYGVDEDGRMVVVEIKRKTAGKEAALQLARYVESMKKSTNREVRGILVAPNIAKGVQKTLTILGLDFKQVDPKKCAEILRKSETKELLDFL